MCKRAIFSGFVDLNQWFENIMDLRYKLQMLGTPVEDPTFGYCENQSVVMNASLQDFTIKNKSNSIVHHFVCEGNAKD